MTAVAILAAGRGTRMRSNLPKVLHPLGGHSLIERVLNSLTGIQPTRQIIIIGHGGEQVKATLQTFPNLEFVEQTPQLGTGHAIQQLLPLLQGFEGDLLVLNGDVPLLRPATLQRLLEAHQTHHAAATLLVAQVPDPQGYGRVFCDSQNRLQKIVEDRDCTLTQKQNRQVNAGIYCFRWPQLASILPHLTPANVQQEYYLTDALNALQPIQVLEVDDYQEILGINDRKQLAAAAQILQAEIKDRWMAAGVTLMLPESITIDETVHLEADVVIEPQTHLRGQTTIGSGSRIGPGSLIQDSQIGEQVTVLYSVVADSVVETATTVGPYTYLQGRGQGGSISQGDNFMELQNTM